MSTTPGPWYAVSSDYLISDLITAGIAAGDRRRAIERENILRKANGLKSVDFNKDSLYAHSIKQINIITDNLRHKFPTRFWDERDPEYLLMTETWAQLRAVRQAREPSMKGE